jgi:hypothetical protein
MYVLLFIRFVLTMSFVAGCAACADGGDVQVCMGLHADNHAPYIIEQPFFVLIINKFCETS